MHTPANLDTEMCAATGRLINLAQLFAGNFFLKSTLEYLLIRLAQNCCQALKLPQSIRRILKDTTHNFTDDFSTPSQCYSHQPATFIPFFPPSAPLTLIPAPFALLLIRIGRLFCLSVITRLKRPITSCSDEKGAL